MDKYILSEKELMETGMAELLLATGDGLETLISRGELSGCRVLPPVWSDGPMVKNLNGVLHTEADYMYYIVIETDNSKERSLEDIKEEAKKIAPLIQNLDNSLVHSDGKTKGLVLDNYDILLHINSVTTLFRDKWVHSVVFMVKKYKDSDPKVNQLDKDTKVEFLDNNDTNSEDFETDNSDIVC